MSQNCDNQSVVSKFAKQERRGLVGILYDFPQQSFLLLLFGVLVISGAVASLVFKVDAPMFMQILYVVAASCGFRIGADTVKHFKQDTKVDSHHTTD